MKIKAIILAAGNSKRFGSPKLLTEFRGQPIINHTIEEVMKVGFEEIILVTQYESLMNLESTHKIHIVRNKNVDKGISHSLQLGIKAARDCDGYMFLVGDQPLLNRKTLQGMINQFKKSNQAIICAGYQRRSGNPTLFSSCYEKELLALKGDKGGKQIINKNLDNVIIYEVEEERELFDIDTLEDYHKLLNLK